MRRSSATRDTPFLRFVERAEDAYTNNSEDSVEEMRRILADVRTQYDQVHLEADKKEAELARLREAVSVADHSHGPGGDDSSKMEDFRANLKKQEKDTWKTIMEERTKNKVYNHMRNRIARELEQLKERLLSMEAQLSRKSSESHRKVSLQERLNYKGAQSSMDLDVLEQEIEYERIVREQAHKNMQAALQAKADAKDRRIRFDEWRHEVALDAANEAFNASAGHLRKMYAVEKLSGNCLQKITFDQVERSETTEDGFQRIRDVTGLADVMDIVHKFLNRDVEHEQLKGTVKEAEVRLEQLRESFERLKRETDGLTLDGDCNDYGRSIYLEAEGCEGKLNQLLEEHEQSQLKLQDATIQVEHMKRWANRVGRQLSIFEELVRVDYPQDLEVFYKQMQRVVDKFIQHIIQHISLGKVQRKNMSQAATKEYHEARRLLADKDFLKVNCRVPASLDAGRPPSRGQGGTEEEAVEVHQQEREKFKHDSRDCVLGATRKNNEGKKKRTG